MTADKVFRSLRAGPDLLILLNAWDRGSARVIEAAGAKAIRPPARRWCWGMAYGLPG